MAKVIWDETSINEWFKNNRNDIYKFKRIKYFNKSYSKIELICSKCNNEHVVTFENIKNNPSVDRCFWCRYNKEPKKHLSKCMSLSITKGQYVYRFKDNKDKVIYVGRTNNIKRRMKEHFKSGHLPLKCYKEVNSIEYIACKSEADRNILEIYLINTYKPKYNKKDVYDGNIKNKMISYGLWIPYEINIKQIK